MNTVKINCSKDESIILHHSCLATSAIFSVEGIIRHNFYSGFELQSPRVNQLQSVVNQDQCQCLPFSNSLRVKRNNVSLPYRLNKTNSILNPTFSSDIFLISRHLTSPAHRQELLTFVTLKPSVIKFSSQALILFLKLTTGR